MNFISFTCASQLQLQLHLYYNALIAPLQLNTIQCNTIRWNTLRYNTLQLNTIHLTDLTSFRVIIRLQVRTHWVFKSIAFTCVYFFCVCLYVWIFFYITISALPALSRSPDSEHTMKPNVGIWGQEKSKYLKKNQSNGFVTKKVVI